MNQGAGVASKWSVDVAAYSLCWVPVHEVSSGAPVSVCVCVCVCVCARIMQLCVGGTRMGVWGVTDTLQRSLQSAAYGHSGHTQYGNFTQN